jgi:SAM-dependent methyltransferase
MSRDTASPAQIAAAETYEQLFVPAEFQEWAPRLVAAAEVQAGQRALDVACGTGVLTRALARIVGPGAVVGLDADPGMLAVAARLAPDVDFHQGSALSLPFADRSFDVVVSQFGLMFFPDRTLALREMWRVLVPGGRLAVAVWDSIEYTPAYADLVALLERAAGRAAADASSAPFVLGDRSSLAAIFAEAGIAGASIATHRGTARFPSVRTMVEAELRGWLPLVGVTLGDQRIDEILGEADEVLARYRTADGRIAFETSAHIVSAARS